MHRRSLLAGAAAVVSSRAKATTYMIFVPPILHPACRQFSVPNNSANDQGNNSLNSHMTCVAPTTSDIVGLRLVFPGFGFDNPEQAIPTASYTVTATVEYPAGVFTRFTISGSPTLTVSSGETTAAFDFLPIVIPAGAIFYIKTYLRWSAGNFWLTGNAACRITTDWTVRGNNLSDLTASATPQTTGSAAVGFGPSVYAAFANPISSLGILGDSIAFAGVYDQPNPNDCSVFIERAMRNVIPTMNLARSSDELSFYLSQNAGRRLLLSGFVSHTIDQYGTNDIYTGNVSLSDLQTTAAQVWNQYIGIGIKVFATTLPPRSTSTDGWATIDNQTIFEPTKDAIRIAYNSWLLSNWQSLGLSGVIDIASAVSAPLNPSLWNADDATGTGAAGFCTLSGGAVSACSLAAYNLGGTSGGSGYPNSSTVACTVRGYPGETGGLPSISATINGSGVITGFTVNSAGSALLYPPMVAANGAWTGDGTHPNARGYNEMIYQTGLSPAMFA